MKIQLDPYQESNYQTAHTGYKVALMLSDTAQKRNRLGKFATQGKRLGFMEAAIAKEREEWLYTVQSLYKRYEMSGGLCDGPYKFLSNLIYTYAKVWGQRVYTEGQKYTTFPYKLHPKAFYSALSRAKANPETPEVYAAAFKEKTFFFVLDIDIDSQYRQGKGWQQLQAFLDSQNIRYLRCQSSYAPDPKHKLKYGIHLYVFLDKPYETAFVRETVKRLLVSNGFEVANGQLEIHPTQGLIRLPLQEGFKILGKTFDSPAKQVKAFLKHACFNSFKLQGVTTPESLKESLETPSNVVHLNDFKGLLFDGKGLIVEQCERGQEFLEHGLTRFHSSHAAIFAMSHYYWYTVGPDDQDRFDRIMQDLQGLHNGFCKLFNRGQLEKLAKEVWQCVTWRRDKSYQQSEKIQGLLNQGYTLEQLAAANNKRQAQAQQKIYEAIVKLTHAGQEITVRAIHKLTNCSFQTIQKHKQAVIDALAAKGVTRQYVGGVCSDSLAAGVKVQRRLKAKGSQVDALEPPEVERKQGLLAVLRQRFGCAFFSSA